MKGGLMAIAGEISGDLHLAAVVRSLRKDHPDLPVWGIGGDECEAAGMEVSTHVRDMAVLGIGEVLKRYGFFRGVFKEMLAALDREQPEAVLLVDYPGFNLRFAKAAHRRGVKVLYYVCPQVWAWNRRRIKLMAKHIDHLMVIFPFEVEVFNGTGLPVSFVGHPLAEEAESIRQHPPRDLPWGEGRRIALLPGSRDQELDRHLDLILKVVSGNGRDFPNSFFLIASASPRLTSRLQAAVDSSPERVQACVKVVEGETRSILRQADLSVVASGTATVEAALQRCPMLVIYKTSALTYALGKMLVKLDFLGMVNIIAGRELCPEFIQGEATPARLSAGIRDLLKNDSKRLAIQEGLEEVAQALKSGRAAENTAEIILSEIGMRK
jgi:lipid-A-disaccharide synthase